MRTKYLFIIAGALGLLFIILMITTLFSRPKQTPNQESPIPTPYPTSSVSASGKRTAVLVSALPTQNLSQQYFPIQQVGFSFSYPVNPDDIDITVLPDAKAKKFIRVGDPGTIVVSPDPTWQPGITTITLKMRQNFQGPYFFTGTVTYQLNTGYPVNPPAGADY